MENSQMNNIDEGREPSLIRRIAPWLGGAVGAFLGGLYGYKLSCYGG